VNRTEFHRALVIHAPINQWNQITDAAESATAMRLLITKQITDTV